MKVVNPFGGVGWAILLYFLHIRVYYDLHIINIVDNLIRKGDTTVIELRAIQFSPKRDRNFRIRQ